MKKKWKLLLGMLIFTMLITNCKKEEPDGSIEKNKFIREVIAFTKNEVLIKTPIKIHELEINENTVDFKNLTVIENKYAIAEFKNAVLTISPDEYAIVLYYLEKKTITAANVIKFKSNLTPAFIKANLSEILSFEYPEYTGSVNITSLYGKFLAEVNIEKGKIISTTSLQGEFQNSTNNILGSLKVSYCTDWYLIVTVYYTLSPPTITKTYLGTTCKTVEGGGSGGSSGGTSDTPGEAGTPCPGDPILSPTIAPTKSGNLYGGMYGCTRQNPNKVDCTNLVYYTFHNGIDIKADLNSNIYSMHDGYIYDSGNSTTLGLYVRVMSNIDGHQLLIQYAHLSQVLVMQFTDVSAGTLIALSGNSGNANTPGTIPHVHEPTWVDWQESDPIGFFGTMFNTNGTITIECNHH